MTVEADSDNLKYAEREVVHDHQLKEKVVNEEFKIWKKTVPLLYNTIQSHVLDSPSLSVQWLPDYEVSENKNSITVKFLYGTHATNSANQRQEDSLNIGCLDLPSTLAPDFAKFAPHSDSIPIPMSNGESESANTFRVVSSWKHAGEINKLALSPSSQKVLTFDNKGVIYLYDISNPTASAAPINFQYHKKEGYSLEWLNETQFISGAHDTQIALWDVDKPSTPIQLFKSHTGIINDLSHNKQAPAIFASVANDYTTQLHDIRSSNVDNENPALTITNSHHQNAVSFHPDVPTLIATGGRDNIVSVYDLRNTQEPVRKLFAHNDSVIGVKWDEHHDPSTLVSVGTDNRVVTWDLNQLDEPFTYPTNDAEVSSRRKTKHIEDPCVKFIHGGHTNRINAVDIHPKIKNLYTSVGDDQLLQVWKFKSTVAEDEDEEEEEDEHDGEDKESNKTDEHKQATASDEKDTLDPSAQHDDDPETKDDSAEQNGKDEDVEMKEQ